MAQLTELLDRAAGGQVQVAAGGPEKLLGTDEGVVFLAPEDTQRHELFGVIVAVSVVPTGVFIWVLYMKYGQYILWLPP